MKQVAAICLESGRRSDASEDDDADVHRVERDDGTILLNGTGKSVRKKMMEQVTMQRFTPNTHMMPSNMKRVGGGYVMRQSPPAAVQQPRPKRMSEVTLLKRKNAGLTLALDEANGKLDDAMERIGALISRVKELENGLNISRNANFQYQVELDAAMTRQNEDRIDLKRCKDELQRSKEEAISKMEELKMQKVVEVAEADSKLRDAIERMSMMTSRIEDLENDLQISRAKNLKHPVELKCGLKTHLNDQAKLKRCMDKYQHVEQGARGKVQSLYQRIEQEATRSDALQRELDVQRSLSTITETSDASSQDDKSESLSSQDQENCAMAHYPSAHFLQSLVSALRMEVKGSEMKLAERAFENHKLRIQVDRLHRDQLMHRSFFRHITSDVGSIARQSAKFLRPSIDPTLKSLQLDGRVYLLPTISLVREHLRKPIQSFHPKLHACETTPVVLDLRGVSSDGSPHSQCIKKHELRSKIASLESNGYKAVGITDACDQAKRVALKLNLPSFISTKGPECLTESSSAIVSSHNGQPEKISDSILEVETAPNNPFIHPPMIIQTCVRSGQQVYAKSRSLVVLGNVNSGAEVMADGDISIFGAFKGRALAGVTGHREARITCGCFDAELVSIAHHFTTCDAAGLSNSIATNRSSEDWSELRLNQPTSIYLDLECSELVFKSSIAG
uniref:Uncharacterized protein AlNc14C183G8260 n=1 Tax=Albugo laibachii Nc14 TaxID=890382 RepID=F0W1V6_9STRA|nr:conserved hypothetical protein [Albugo laibachii Nc14]CCA23158.1 conserved hypothetical protein [Albugo laibachii Nc14]|eukprot:CCA23158.1 conserved hypothetical protein [Albugo laibachii Nc14]